MGHGHGCQAQFLFSLQGAVLALELSPGPWSCRAVLAWAQWCGPKPASLASEGRACARMWNCWRLWWVRLLHLVVLPCDLDTMIDECMGYLLLSKAEFPSLPIPLCGSLWNSLLGPPLCGERLVGVAESSGVCAVGMHQGGSCS